MMTQTRKAPSKLELINPASRAEIDREINKYPKKKGAVMAALRILQAQHGGWLTTDIMDAIAEYLHMQPIEVYEVATFYSMYELDPVGRHNICVCTNISCMLCDSHKVVDHLEKRLGVKLGETTSDGKFSLKEVECLGACVDAPMFQIGTTYYGTLNPEKIDKVLDSLE